jgi:signal transduction histidine kinase
VPAAIVAGTASVAAERVAGVGLAVGVADLAAGLALLGCAAVGLARRPRSLSGPLAALAAATWFAGDLSPALVYAHRGPLVHLLLSFPGDRRPRPVARIVIAAAYIDGLVPAVARSDVPTIALMGTVIAVAITRFVRASRIDRGATAVALAGAVAIAGTLAVAAAARLADAGADAATLAAYQAAIVITSAGLAAQLAWGRTSGAAVTGLVVDLGDRHEPSAMRAAVAHALGDPGLRIAYRVGDDDSWVDEAGRAVAMPAAGGAGREVTMIEEGGTAVAALSHDRAALSDRDLLASVAIATRLAVANARLQADVAARVREVDVSRRRLVEASDEARRRLREELHEGAERRLAAVPLRLSRLALGREGETARVLGELVVAAEVAQSGLDRFAHGVHPRALTESGLHGALAELADQSAVPVTLDMEVHRLAPVREAALFFVCSEALANVSKYANATEVRISVRPAGSWIRLTVVDNGTGGADPARGTGLRGLSDRLEALAGTLRVTSPAGRGTRLEADLPLHESVDA